MNTLFKNHFDIGYMDTLAGGNSPLHRLNPMAKLITTLWFIITVISFDKYTLLALIPFFIYPMSLTSAGGLPIRYLLKKVMLFSPLAILLSIFNPVIDREIVLHIGTIGISGGWISFFSILMRCILTVSAALLLIALTGFNAVCEALIQFGVPKSFVIQLLFFYRYLFVLTDEAHRMERARTVRSFHKSAMRYKTFISLIGHLLLRTLDRAERIYRAMCCRGFDGHFRLIKTIKMGWKDFGFTAGWGILFIIFRFYNIPLMLGKFVTGVK